MRLSAGTQVLLFVIKENRMLEAIRQDWKKNPGNYKIRFVLLFYRITHQLAIQKRRRPVLWAAGTPVLLAYRILVEWLLCIELPAKTMVGPGLCIFHGQALTINDHVVIGSNCVLRHCTTIGCLLGPNREQRPSPVIGNNVEIGSNVVIIGDIRVGDDAVIGAGAVVTKDVPSRAIVVGNPARILRFKDEPQVVSVRQAG